MMKTSTFAASCLVVFSIVGSFAIANNDHHTAPAPISADQAMAWLKNGNKRFVTNKKRNDGAGASDIQRLSTGQKPHSIILSCSDSRVPPELVFDQALGEIFVIRVAGEALDSSVIGSIEYAVEHLGSKNIIVLGHTQCGAVKASLQTAEGASAGSPALDQLVADIKPRLQSVKRTPSSDLSVESSVNAKGVAADLLKRSKIISHKVEAGEVKITPALYHLDDGKVDFLGH